MPSMPKVLVSIHAPNEGSDTAWLDSARRNMFQSTLPMKGATKSQFAEAVKQKVSIHAPNEGSDELYVPP